MGQTAVQGSVLLVGAGVLADSLAATLGSEGIDLQRASRAQGAVTAHALAPDLIVLAADAAQDCGASVVEQLTQLKQQPPLPVLVMSAPDRAGGIPKLWPHHVAHLSPAGGTKEFARHARAVLEVLTKSGAADRSLQQLLDALMASAKAAAAKPPGASPVQTAEASAVNAPAPSPAKAAAPGPAKVAPSAANAPAPSPAKAAAVPSPAKAAVSAPIGPTAGTPLAASAASRTGAAAGSSVTGAANAQARPVSSQATKAQTAAKATAPTQSAAVSGGSAAATSIAHAPAVATTLKEPASSTAVPQPTAAGAKPVPADKPSGTSQTLASVTSPRLGQPGGARVGTSSATSQTLASVESMSATQASAATPVTLGTAPRVPLPGAGANKSSAASATVASVEPTPTTPGTAPRLGQPVAAPKKSSGASQTLLGVTSPRLGQPAAPGNKPSAASASTASVESTPGTSPRIPLPGAAAKTSSGTSQTLASVESTPGTSPRLGPASATVDKSAASSKQAAEGAAFTNTAAASSSSSAHHEKAKPGPASTAQQKAPNAGAPSTEARSAVTSPGSVARPATVGTKAAEIAGVSVAALESSAEQGDRAQGVLASSAAVSGASRAATGAPLPAAEPKQKVKGAPQHETAKSRAAYAAVSRATAGAEPPVAVSQRPTAAPGLKAQAESDPEPGIVISFSEPAQAAPAASVKPRRETVDVRAASLPAGPSPLKRNTTAVGRRHAAKSQAPSSPGPRAEVNAVAAESTRREVAKSDAAATSAEPAARPGAERADGASAAPPQDARTRARRLPTNPLAPVVSRPPRNDSAPAPKSPLDTAATPPRAARRVRNPLDAPQTWPAVSASIADVSPSLEVTPVAARGGRAVRTLFAIAAISGAGLSVWWFYGGSIDFGSKNPALGALQQIPSVAAAPPTAAAPTVVSPAPSSGTIVATNAALVPSLPIPRSVTARPSTQGRAPEGGSDLSRAQALVDEGMSLLKQGRLGLAESSYQKALGLVPEFPSATAALVRVHLARRDGAEAVRWANRLITKQPKNAENQLLLGDALALRGDAQAARDAWTTAARRGNATARQRLKEE